MLKKLHLDYIQLYLDFSYSIMYSVMNSTIVCSLLKKLFQSERLLNISLFHETMTEALKRTWQMTSS